MTECSGKRLSLLAFSLHLDCHLREMYLGKSFRRDQDYCYLLHSFSRLDALLGRSSTRPTPFFLSALQWNYHLHKIFRDVVIPRNASKHHYELNDRCRSVSRVSRSPVTPKAEIPSLPSLIKVHSDADTRPFAQAGESERGTDET